MAYAIMRCEKIKNMGRLGGSFLHAFRERETLNADSTRTAGNVDYFARNAEEAMTRAKLTLPEKIRKNGVIAVEYLFTASPEWFKTATSAQKKEFFDRSVDWLAEKYGRAHIITATVHNDETTPHLTAVVIPIDPRGKLNARGFIGGAEKLRKDQDTYAAAVSSLGLVRGIRGSKARHSDIKNWYGELHLADPVNQKLPSTWVGPDDLKPKKTGFLEHETPQAVANRINNQISAAERKHEHSWSTLAYRCRDQQKTIDLQQKTVESLSREVNSLSRENREQREKISSLQECMRAFQQVLGVEKLKQIWQQYVQWRDQSRYQHRQQDHEKDQGRNTGRGR